MRHNYKVSDIKKISTYDRILSYRLNNISFFVHQKGFPYQGTVIVANEIQFIFDLNNMVTAKK